MSFRKPFRAVPIRLSPYQQAIKRNSERNQIATVLAKAAIFGALIGVGTVAYDNGIFAILANGLHAPIGNRSKFVTTYGATQIYYSGCNAARAAGAAPIYAGQPGYRSGMDGDGDGIACEPPPLMIVVE